MAAPEHSTVTDTMTPESTDATGALPQLPPAPETTDDPASRAALAAVRCFCQGVPDGQPSQAEPDDGFLPALLVQFRDPSRIRRDYPLLVPDAPEADELCRPVGEMLRSVAEAIAPGDDEARILKDNLKRLERLVRDAIAGREEPADAAAVLGDAARAMADGLGLRGDSDAQLREDLRRLVEAAPAGRLLDLDERSALWLLLAAARHRATGRRAELRRHAENVLGGMRELVRLDRDKQGEGRSPEALGAVAGVQMDPDALAAIIGKTHGAPALEASRRERIDAMIEVLERFIDSPDPPMVTVVAHGAAPAGWPEGAATWRAVERGSVCRAAATAFDEGARTVAGVLAAIRVGRLELDDRYEPARHDPLLSSFDWESFTTEELGLLPVVVAVESADHLAGAGLRDVSRLMRSGRPVQVIVTVVPAANPGEPEDALGGYRFELGYFGLSHREAAVQQSSAARPAHLAEGYLRSVDAAAASLHVITSGLTGGGAVPPLGSWMHAGAALEGRAHPFFHYDPRSGSTWARRFEISDNPQPESDWPTYDLACADAGGAETTISVAFTFADYVLLDGGRGHFRVIPPSVDPAALRPLHEHLELDEETAASGVPFVWAADAQGRLHRLAVSHRLVFACRDRLDYWRTLQELAGVRNEHVREAVEWERERLGAEFAEQLQQLERDHEEALARAREESAGQAMQALARGLLDAGPAALAGALSATPAPVAPAAPGTVEAAPADAPEAAAVEEPAAAEEDDEVAAEPWIDTPLCTSCNDCIQMNQRLFVYNANKQAVIGDPTAGTYRQLVEAAEKCPARCIHPGLPLNPDEPDLDALKARAKPFM
ncbi:MAG: ferredoxin [Planctomycetota bacterium]|jgi:ferredoxin